MNIFCSKFKKKSNFICVLIICKKKCLKGLSQIFQSFSVCFFTFKGNIYRENLKCVT